MDYKNARGRVVTVAEPSALLDASPRWTRVEDAEVIQPAPAEEHEAATPIDTYEAATPVDAYEEEE